MAQITASPFLLKDVTFQVGADDYEAHVSSVEFTPSSSVVTWKGLTPSSTFSASTTPTWVCALNFAQDWTTPNSLSRYLFDNVGSSVTATFTPLKGGAVFSATLLITPGAIGGQVDTYAAATVSLGVIGKPTVVSGS